MKSPKPKEWAQEISALRAALQFTPQRLADELGVTLSTIYAWERAEAKYSPSGEIYIRLGNTAARYGKDPTWFWEGADLDMNCVESFAEKRLKARGAAPQPGEVVRVGPMSLDRNEAGERQVEGIVLPARFVPNPASTKYVTIGGDLESSVFPDGDVLVFDVSITDLPSLWDKVVLAYFDPKERDRRPQYARWPDGFFVGRLIRTKTDRSDAFSLTWAAELTSSLQQESREDIRIGFWSYPLPPLEGNREQQDAAMKARNRAGREARELVSTKFVDLGPGCRILGQMICWFSRESAAAPKEKSQRGAG